MRVGEQELSLDWERGQVFDAVVAHTYKEIVSPAVKRVRFGQEDSDLEGSVLMVDGAY